MHLFVCNGVKSRRKQLETHFVERGIYDFFESVHFFDDFSPEHPYVKWFHKFVTPHMSLYEISGLVKHMEMLQTAVEMDLEEFVTVDDDVVFIENWKDGFSLPFDFYECMALGVNYHVMPGPYKVETGNIGGCECNRISKKFAQFILDNIDFRQATDILYSAVLAYHKKPLCIVPVCQQTSILGNQVPKTTYEIDWKTFIQTYRPNGVKYTDIKSKYKDFMMMKAVVDEDFERRFNQKYDIWNVEYIYLRYRNIRSS